MAFSELPKNESSRTGLSTMHLTDDEKCQEVILDFAHILARGTGPLKHPGALVPGTWYSGTPLSAIQLRTVVRIPFKAVCSFRLMTEMLK